MPEVKTEQIAVRVERGVTDELDRRRKELEAKVGMDISRSDLIRMFIHRGLERSVWAEFMRGKWTPKSRMIDAREGMADEEDD